MCKSLAQDFLVHMNSWYMWHPGVTVDPCGERTLFSNPDVTILGWRSAAIVKNRGSNIQSYLDQADS